MAKGFDFHVDLISAREAREQFPLLEPSGVVGAAWIEGDGYVDPASLTHAYAAAARRGGAALIQGVRVTAIRTQRRRVTTVVTDAGEIDAESVIDAAGMWGSEIAAMVGTRVPVGAVEHQYFVTEKTDRIPAGLPSLRDPDSNFYVKPETGALALGGWERPWDRGRVEPLPPDVLELAMRQRRRVAGEG